MSPSPELAARSSARSSSWGTRSEKANPVATINNPAPTRNTVAAEVPNRIEAATIGPKKDPIRSVSPSVELAAANSTGPRTRLGSSVSSVGSVMAWNAINAANAP